MTSRPLSTLLLVALVCATAAVRRPAAREAVLPRLVFVARRPAEDGVVPGLGPAGRMRVTGGRLLVREPDGRVHALLAHTPFVDVADPAVSWDGGTVAFAAARAPTGPWRIWRVRANGLGLAPVTRDTSGARVDDFDPCWLPDGRLVFASTRFHQRSQRDVAASNLFVVRADGGGLARITAERNGAEEPAIDPRNGRVVFARWWFNRWRASDDPPGVTLDSARAVPAERVDLWHAISVTPDGDLQRLAGGDARVRRDQSAYQPIVLEDGTLVGVAADSTALLGAPGRLQIQRFPGGLAAAQPLTPRGASACAPCALPGGGVLVSCDVRGGTRFALMRVRAVGAKLEPVLALPGWALLDAAVLARRRTPPVIRVRDAAPMPDQPLSRLEQLRDFVHTFRFDCLNVFANGAVDAALPDAPRAQPGVRIRFFALLVRPAAAGGDTAVLLRDAPVRGSGAVHVEDLPSDTPVFEQLVDAHGHVLRAGSGPAHVAGTNFARFGSGTKCVGCHAGHSTLAIPAGSGPAEWTNLAPSAELSSSGVAARTAGVRAAVDRRANGSPTQVAWIADSTKVPWLRLAWSSPVEVGAFVLYACRRDAASPSAARILASDILLERNGRELRRIAVDRPLDPLGTRVQTAPVVVDAVEFRPRRWAPGGTPALAEIEAIARLAAP